MHLPPNQPPPPLAHQQFWRWFSHLSRRTQIIGCGVLLFSCVICTGVSAIAGKSNQSNQTPQTTPVVVATAAPTQAPTETIPPVMPTAAVTHPIPTTSVATPAPTQKPTQQPVDPTANIPKVPGLGSENGPELGSPLSVFVKTFGPTTDNIWGIGGNDVSLAVDTTGSKVTFIFISTDDKVTWSKDQTNMIAFCSEFMPLDVATSGSPRQSSEFYSQNYTSSIGDFYMLINHSGGPGTWSCDMETGSN